MRRGPVPAGKRRWSPLALGWLLSAAGGLSAQTVMTGVVRQDSSGRPLAGVGVLIEGLKQTTVTDASGRYVLGDLKPGRRIAIFRYIGYQPVRRWVQLDKNDTTHTDAIMVPLVPQLATLDVTGRVPGPRGMGREGFEERRKLGFGKFIDSVELRRSDGIHVSDVLRHHGVYIVNHAECPNQRCGPQEERAASRTKSTYFGDPCYMQVVLDGVILNRSVGSVASGVDRAPPPDFRRDIDVASLESIEIYETAAKMPIEYLGWGSDCGTIVLWTRRR